ncbi:DUF5079 family protein [Staphylococcus caeli]|uniref:DUF5079 family protein n=1 Tax=Staphylococcus caeli TaxID=2201815 RepID=A0A1D4JZH7_9STAP|nr:DUF5079 family protein [Staphylococcus caeli]SCS66931.1 Uncharacterised protein [Staphylococcus caeli]SCS85973.1 Uncharacterised protein [Staphylococcus caeli]
MKENFVKNIKKAYISPFAIFINALTLLFSAIIILDNHLLNKLPIYICVFYILWIIINIIYLIQEKNKKYKMSKLSVVRYLIINILCGYSVSMAFASVYVFGALSQGYLVFDYWLLVIGAIFLSWLGLHIFAISEFDIANRMSGSMFNLLGIILKLISFALLIYLSVVVPEVEDVANFIWGSIIIIICSDLLIGRSYFNYAFYLSSIEDKN